MVQINLTIEQKAEILGELTRWTWDKTQLTELIEAAEKDYPFVKDAVEDFAGRNVVDWSKGALMGAIIALYLLNKINLNENQIT